MLVTIDGNFEGYFHCLQQVAVYTVCTMLMFQPGLIPPQAGDMETIKHYLDKMQRAYSPLKKLENLLSATTAIYSCVKVSNRSLPERRLQSI